MRRLALCCALLGLMLGGQAAAEEPRSPATCTPPGGGALTIDSLLALTIDWPSSVGQTLRLPVEIASRPRAVAAAAGQSIDIVMTPPVSGIAAATAWNSAIFLGAGRRTDGPETKPTERLGLRATVIARGGTPEQPTLTVRQQVPNSSVWMFPSHSWLLVLAACDAATGQVLGQAVTEIHVTSAYWSRAGAALAIALFYGLLVAAAYHCNRQKMLRVFQRPAPPAQPDTAPPPGFGGWALRRAIDPVFVSQDATGNGSLSRLQLLLFSLAVGFVSVNIFMATGAIAALSTDVLWLLGITVVATGLARVVPSNSGLGAEVRLWIAQRRLLRNEDLMPTWRDIVTSDGEIDVTRVQAIIFTLVTLMALLVTGLGDLSEFKVSDEVKFLLGLSQAAYIGGKAVTSEAIKQLDLTIRALIAAEAQGADAFEQAKPAAVSILSDVYGARFRREAFQAMKPGQVLDDVP